MDIEFETKAEATRWLRLTAAALGRSGHFWTELRDGRLHSGAASADVRVDVSMPCDGARPLARRWHARASHPSTRPAMRFEPARGALAPPDDHPPHALATPFGAAPTELPESIARHPIVQRVQRAMPGTVPEVRFHPGRFTFIWSSPTLRVRLQLHTTITAQTCDLPAAAGPHLRHATDALAGILGGRGHVVLTGRACADIQPATYRLVEASRLIPSHDAHTFRPRPDYPAGVQERRYHADKAEQQKVIDNSAPGCFQPAIIVNTDPTALGGTPIATPEGVVLGGNSRTMVLQRIYAATPPTAANAYRKHLTAHLHEFNLPPAALAGMTAPVVVRVVEPPTADKAHLRDLVRRYNEGLTQDLERTAEQVAVSARLNDAILAELQRVEDDTLAAFLASPASKGLVRLLVQAELIPKARQNRLISAATGLLSDEGRALLQRALLGRILPHPDLLDLLTESLKDSLARATPYILNAATVHADPATRARWDVTHRLPDAVRVWSRARAASLKDASELAAQRELTTDGLDPLDTPNVLLANLLLLRAGSRQLPAAFRAFAEASAYTNTPSLFGDHILPVPALAKAAKLPVPSGTGIANVGDFSPSHDAPKPAPAPKPVAGAELDKVRGAWKKAMLAAVQRALPDLTPQEEMDLGSRIAARLHKVSGVAHRPSRGAYEAELTAAAGEPEALAREITDKRAARDREAQLLARRETENARREAEERATLKRDVLPDFGGQGGLLLTIVAERADGSLVTGPDAPTDPTTFRDLDNAGFRKVWVSWKPEVNVSVSWGGAPRPLYFERLAPVLWRDEHGAWHQLPFDPWLGHPGPQERATRAGNLMRAARKGGLWVYSESGLRSDIVRIKPDKADFVLTDPWNLGTLWWVPHTIAKGVAQARDRIGGVMPARKGRARAAWAWGGALDPHSPSGVWIAP